MEGKKDEVRIQGTKRERWRKTVIETQDDGSGRKSEARVWSIVAVAITIGTAEHKVFVYDC